MTVFPFTVSADADGRRALELGDGAHLHDDIARALSRLGRRAEARRHAATARRLRVAATWPFFIPAPLLSLIGTLGAVIRLRSTPRTRRALVDIGAAGPIAGFLVTIPVLAVGLRLSTVVPEEGPFRHWTLWDSLQTWIHEGRFLHLREGFDLGKPLGMVLLENLAVHVPP